MTPNDFQKLCLRTEVTPDFVNMPVTVPQAPDHNRKLARLLHGMIGVCTEAGELQDMVKKHSEWLHRRSRPQPRPDQGAD